MQEVIMPLLQVRNCPEELYREIAKVARREHRSIAQQVVVLLQSSLQVDIENCDRRVRLLDRVLSQSIPEAARSVDIVTMIREDRDR